MFRRVKAIAKRPLGSYWAPRLVIPDQVTTSYVLKAERLPLQVLRRHWRSSSKIFKLPNYIFRRASSPKNGFFADRFEVVKRASFASEDYRVPPGVLDLYVTLRKNEDNLHFIRSLKRGSFRGLRDIALVPVECFSNKSKDVTLYSISTTFLPNRMKADTKIHLLSVASFPDKCMGKRKISYKDLPSHIIRIVEVENSNAGVESSERWLDGFCRWKKAPKFITNVIDESERNDVRIPATRDPWLVLTLRRLLLGCCTIILALFLGLPQLVNSDGNSDRSFSQFDAGELVWISMLLLLVLFSVIYLFIHLLRWLLHEIARPKTWTAGTTGCLRDGDILRNGRADLWDTL